MRHYAVRALDSLWAILLAAWLGSETIAERGRANRRRGNGATPSPAARSKLNECLSDAALLRLLDGAAAVLDGRDPPAAFSSPAGEQWREILAALQSLGGEQAADTGGEATRLLWEVEIGKQGRNCWHQAARTEARPARLGPAARHQPGEIAGNEQLPAWDIKVARALRAEPGYSNRYHLDLAAAIVALVGHPCVVLAESPEQFVDLTESGAGARTGSPGRPLRDAHRAAAAAGQRGMTTYDADERAKPRRCA
jgi:hypothetical protein